jgi:hypothetical protein
MLNETDTINGNVITWGYSYKYLFFKYRQIKIIFPFGRDHKIT